MEAPAKAHISDKNDLKRASDSFITVENESTVAALDNDPLQLSKNKIPHDILVKLKAQKRKLFDFYKQQNEHIDYLLVDEQESQEEADRQHFKLKIAIYGSVLGNLLLFALQLYAAISSKSFSLFATMADAFMDLASSLVIVAAQWFASRDSFKYPTGKKRMEIIGVVVFAILMSILSIQLIIESIKNLINKESDLDLEPMTLVCIGIAVLVKICLYLYCNALKQFPTAKIFALDHRNDVILNIFGITSSILGAKIVWWMDPIGGLLIALLILKSWSGAAFEHMQLLVGKTANSEFLQKITYVSMTHDDRINQVDTVRAYHAGHGFFVEVDIVLDPSMSLKEAHDIGESLQIRLEALELVERAFVHLDYEFLHKPEHLK